MVDLKTLSDAAEPGPWEYRPRKHDDWGLIRGSAKVFDDEKSGPPVAVSKPRWDDYDFEKHRAAGTDPMEANGRFIVELVNAFRKGSLVVKCGGCSPDVYPCWQCDQKMPLDLAVHVRVFREMQDALLEGCHDRNCVIKLTKGQVTNGGCNCLEYLTFIDRQRLGHMLISAQKIVAMVEKALHTEEQS